MSSIRLSVCLSVTLVDKDHIGWKSWKLIAHSFSRNLAQHLRSLQPKELHPGEHWEIWGTLEVLWEKVACWSTKVAISETRKDRGKVIMENL